MQSQIAERKGKVAPKAKDKQDEAIIGTNDYSIVSKRSVEKFYYQDEPQFLRAFVHKFKRRAPLVNRGYWLRMRAIEAVVQSFLNETTDNPKAIVNLGCGYEPLAFRMLWKYPQQCRDVKFVDVDFPPLIAKKVAMIKREPLLHQQLDVNEDEELIHPSVYYANRKYCAVACDLGDQALLRQVLNDRLHLNKNAILFISEVAIVYMPPDEATNVISFCSTFPDGQFSYALMSAQANTFKLEYACLNNVYLQGQAIHLLAQCMTTFVGRRFEVLPRSQPSSHREIDLQILAGETFKWQIYGQCGKIKSS